MKIDVNVEYLREQKVHICLPCYGGMLTESTFMSFIKWSNIARQLGVDWTVETMTNESLISRGRNTLSAKFLAKEESTHLMFIDADIGWEPWHLIALLMRDLDVVGGLYPMKTLPVKWVVNGVEGAKSTDDGLIEVSKTGTGFLLIKRRVFEKLKEHPEVVQYNADIGLDPKYNEFMYTFFDTGVRENRYYSEDWWFCDNWRQLGGKVFVDKRILLKHSGSFTFSNEAQDRLKSAYKPNDEPNQ